MGILFKSHSGYVAIIGLLSTDYEIGFIYIAGLEVAGVETQ